MFYLSDRCGVFAFGQADHHYASNFVTKTTWTITQRKKEASLS